jgi:thiol-disulfide isomerase/thioredoxin
MKLKHRSASVQGVLACVTASAVVAAAMLSCPLTSRAADSVSNGNAPINNGAMGNGPMPTSQPAPDMAPQRDIKDITQEYAAVNRQIAKLLPADVVTDPSKREAAAPGAIPLVYHRLQLIDELAATKKVPPMSIAQLKQTSQSTLYLLGDAPTVTKVNGMIASKDPVRQTEGKSIQLYSRWTAAGSDKVEAGKVVDELEKLDRANPADSKLTLLTVGLAQTAKTEELNTRLIALVTDVMTDPYATRIKSQIAAQKKGQEESEAKQKALLDKPFVIAAKTVDGKDFSTADLSGKVVLVDFWATWCGPCRASLPHVKETYAKYHDKGLEIVGVSNDYDIKALQKFTPENNMPWTQLFDPAAAANQQWNPVTLSNGIHGIPTMFLIDKKGILRSITAREDMDDLIPKLLAE